MTPQDFRAWRERCGYPTWGAVALALGIDERSAKRYAAPLSTASHQRIPATIQILCTALEILIRAGLIKKPARGRAGRVSQLS